MYIEPIVIFANFFVVDPRATNLFGLLENGYLTTVLDCSFGRTKTGWYKIQLSFFFFYWKRCDIIQKLHTHSGSNNSDMHHPNVIYKTIEEILIVFWTYLKKSLLAISIK